MVDQYMNYHTFKEIMSAEDLDSSMAVRVYLDRASHYFAQQKAVQKAVKAHPGNLVLAANLKRLDALRAENVWLAIDTAKAEKLQGWKYLEDGSDFVSSLLIRYEGDLSQCSREERLKTEYIELLEQERQREIRTTNKLR